MYSSLESYYTNVEDLHQLFHELVDDHPLTKRILYVHGVIGAGKRSLLEMYRLHCRNKNIPVALVSEDDLTNLFDVLRELVSDLQESNLTFDAFNASEKRHDRLIARILEEASKHSGQIAGSSVEIILDMVGLSPIAPVVGKTLEMFIHWLMGILPEEDVEFVVDPIDQLTKDLKHGIEAYEHRIVLLFDSYGRKPELDQWIRELVNSLPSNVLIVITGEAILSNWPDWESSVLIKEMDLITQEDMHSLVRDYFSTLGLSKPDPRQVKEIVQFARGLPLAATVSAKMMLAYSMPLFRQQQPKILFDLRKMIFDSIPKRIYPILEAASTVRWFNKQVLHAILVEGEVVDATYEELGELPFVRSRSEGLTLHTGLRELIDDYLRHHDKVRHRKLHENAAAYFEERLNEAGRKRREYLTLEILYHRTMAEEEAGIQLFRQLCDDLLKTRFVNQLRSIVSDVMTYPLIHEKHDLWREYYGAYIRYLEKDYKEAERRFERIARDELAPPLLKADLPPKN